MQLAAATIGIGGRGDPTSSNVPHKVNGHVVPRTFTYIPVDNPAGLNIDSSVNAGVPTLNRAVRTIRVSFCWSSAIPKGPSSPKKCDAISTLPPRARLPPMNSSSS